MVTGCGGGETASNPTPTDEPIGPQPVPTELLVEPPNDVNWITPGKVQVFDYYAGAIAEYPMRVHNGNAEPTVFQVTVRIPDYTASGYLPPTPESLAWVTIVGDETPLGAYETRDMTVSLNMPWGAVAPALQWEFWVSVIDSSQKTSPQFVQEEVCVRWLITMKE